ncbi:hypothetical protein N802_12305 [Knoellia sinensis KCTC 19936]|uniref:Uncharacterized protein n=1 Tax=Knoellia sinensis KCTC 19936 TaxID=1385520 RepID=A0A0A0JC54_9MICO|nr:hypothetical protein [Knoellia sinensis]KGN34384.1 hypothetical protein N802_12305 [Knoellia sinensis KCTC 19936]
MSAANDNRPSRWWIAAVPVAIVTMLLANGFRVPVFWYQSGQHREIASGDANEWVSVTEETSDAHGDLTRKYDVRFAGLGGAETAYESRAGEFTLPEGMVARSVKLDFRAEPDQVLKHCAVTLIDDEGREYRVGHVEDDLGAKITVCVPEETPGPSAPIVDAETRGTLPPEEQPRPSEWSASPAIAVPADARFVEVRISFENPDYVRIRLLS